MTGLDYAVMYNLTNTHTPTDTQTIHTHTRTHTLLPCCRSSMELGCVSIVFVSCEQNRNSVTPCSNGLPGIEFGDVCCPESCGSCGGSRCSSRPGGASECCTSYIKSVGPKCGDSGSAPCLMDGSTKRESPAFNYPDTSFLRVSHPTLFLEQDGCRDGVGLLLLLFVRAAGR